MKTTPFETESFFPKSLFDAITEIRVQRPEIILAEAETRKRRERLTRNGKLVILAADHPGRGVTHSGANPVGMASRYEYLARILRVLTQPGVDGVMSTPDILEELLIVNYLIRERGGGSFLDGKVLIGCMNRGGLSGAVFEMRDRFGAFTAAQLHRMRFDAAKMMFRLDLQNPDSGATIHECAEALRDLQALDLPAFLEPLPVERSETGYRAVKSAEAMIPVIGVATALGNSSRLLWLKIPYVEDYQRVVRSTTSPILMLGGPSGGDPKKLLYDFAAGMAAGGNVRGVLVGRNILFPGEQDPAAMAAAVASIVHDGVKAARAVESLKDSASVAPLVPDEA